MTIALLLQTASCLFMTGLIWFVQVVHYPLMAKVSAAQFADYEAQHQRRTGWVVAPVMLLELGTAIGLVFTSPTLLLWLNLGLLGLIWLSTFCLQMPAHQRLQEQWNPSVHLRLVSTNWIRTVLWTVRSGLLLWLG